MLLGYILRRIGNNSTRRADTTIAQTTANNQLHHRLTLAHQSETALIKLSTQLAQQNVELLRKAKSFAMVPVKPTIDVSGNSTGTSFAATDELSATVLRDSQTREARYQLVLTTLLKNQGIPAQAIDQLLQTIDQPENH